MDLRTTLVIDAYERLIMMLDQYQQRFPDQPLPRAPEWEAAMLQWANAQFARDEVG